MSVNASITHNTLLHKRKTASQKAGCSVRKMVYGSGVAATGWKFVLTKSLNSIETTLISVLISA